jgi:sialate O-acetylesterase
MKTSFFKIILPMLLLFSGYSNVYAKLSVAEIFSNHMVLQRNKNIKIWGEAKPNEEILISFANQKTKAKANKFGKWIAVFAPEKAGGPYILSVKNHNERITISDVLVGEVWICSGQSNMDFRLDKVNNADYEIKNANFPLIRTFVVDKQISFLPQKNLKGAWKLCLPENASAFSAVAYFFAKELYSKLNIPIGIINSSWGGTDIEPWMSVDAIQKVPAFRDKANKMKSPDFENFVRQNESNKNKFEAASSNDIGITEKWYEPNHKISDWAKLPVPGIWSTPELSPFNGVVWFSYEFNLPEDSKGKEAILNLGPIDDDDITWVNGYKVGTTRGYYINRRYSVPAGILQDKNRITIKISDYRGNGGMYASDEKEIRLEIGDKQYPLAGEWSYKISVSSEDYHYVENGPNDYPSLLFNAMIHPLIGFSIQGVIWYQGENNAERAKQYEDLFPEMINDWRLKWEDEFPFYWVQLPNFSQVNGEPEESGWANLRWAQTKTLILPKTGQAVTIDIGEANDIHPRNKQDVGKRLSLIALHNDYGYTDLVYSGPVLKTIQQKDSILILSFDQIANGLYAKDKYEYLKGFAVAGADGKYYWAKAKIMNDKVYVYSKFVQKPLSVRYAWAYNPDDANLYNSAALPASPFEAEVK